MDYRITPLGDHAITVAFGTIIDTEINKYVLSLFAYLKNKRVPYIKDIIPAYASLSIVYDVMDVYSLNNSSPYSAVKDLLEQTIKEHYYIEPLELKTLYVPVCYDISLGPDLLKISKEKDISVDEIIEIHSSKIYRVYMIGFLPGFAYMGDVDERIATPRKSVPEKNILPGSVGIANSQTGIYPFNSPGGWNIIGRTPEPLFYPDLDEATLFKPGDNVQFIPISLNDFKNLQSAQ